MGKHGGSRGETPRMSIGKLHRNWLWLTLCIVIMVAMGLWDTQVLVAVLYICNSASC